MERADSSCSTAREKAPMSDETVLAAVPAAVGTVAGVVIVLSVTDVDCATAKERRGTAARIWKRILNLLRIKIEYV